MKFTFLLTEYGDEKVQTLCSMTANSKFEVETLVNYLIAEAMVERFDNNGQDIHIEFQENSSYQNGILDLDVYIKDLTLPYESGYPPYIKMALLSHFNLPDFDIELPTEEDYNDEFFVKSQNQTIEVLSPAQALKTEIENTEGLNINIYDYITDDRIGIYTKLGKFNLYYRWM